MRKHIERQLNYEYVNRTFMGIMKSSNMKAPGRNILSIHGKSCSRVMFNHKSTTAPVSHTIVNWSCRSRVNTAFPLNPRIHLGIGKCCFSLLTFLLIVNKYSCHWLNAIGEKHILISKLLGREQNKGRTSGRAGRLDHKYGM